MARQPSGLKRSKYRLLGLIGQGQFGQVFCAVHRQTGRLVALKNLEQDRFPTHKFLRELRFLLSLKHPNIVTFQSLEHTPTGRYLVMDYCEGGTLRNLMTDEIRPSLPCSIKVVADVLAGLEQAHKRGIVHCDIKPENILLHLHANGWTARISDFGIAQLSQEIVQQESPVGSPAYMAPERFYGQYSVSSDLYSVGILLFELLVGYRPFSGTPAELMSAHLNEPVQLPAAIPVMWRPIITQALQKLPARRFRSAGEMLEAIRAVAGTGILSSQTLPAQSFFLASTELIACSFQAQYQEPIDRSIARLAIIPRQGEAEAEPSGVEPTAAPFEPIHLLQATERQLWQQTYHGEWLIPTQSKQPSVEIATTPEPIEQLLIRPQGCHVVTRRSVGLLSYPAGCTASYAVDFPIQGTCLPTLKPLVAWEGDSTTTIDPTGRWLATLPLVPSTQPRELKFLRLLGNQGFQLASSMPWSQPASEAEVTRLLALDSRHLAIMTTGTGTTVSSQAEGEALSTQIKIVSRRGNPLGSLDLGLQLQHIVLTSTPYQLLATEGNHSDAVLLIDLKPYRIKRLWSAITPQFLAATNWGYILAETKGQITFLDQAGRLIGTTTSPAPIVAIAPVQQHGLMLATWDGIVGSLYSLDLRLLGLDLIF